MPYATEIAVGFVGFLTPLVLNEIRKALINLKYNISGKYIATYSDIVDGARVTEKTIADLKQRGHSIRGKNIHPDGRTWCVKGDFLNGRYFCGLYYAEARYDLGSGSFFFDYNGNDFEGLWAGYDNENRQTTSGAYQMRRMSEVKIRTLKKPEKSLAMNMSFDLKINHLLARQRQGAIKISEQQFGPEYVTKESFNISHAKPVLLAAQAKSSLVGFLISYLVEKDRAAEVVWPGCDVGHRGTDVGYADKHGQLGIIKTVAVLEDMQGRGIGTRLIQSAERRLRRLKATTILVPAWQRSDGTTSIEGVVAHLGFERWKTCELFWKEDCDAGKFSCACREPNGSCSCNMVLFKKSYTH